MFLSTCQCLGSVDILPSKQEMLTQKGNQNKQKRPTREEKAQAPPPPSTALSHSQTALLATQLGNAKGKAGGGVGIAPAISTKPCHMNNCCIGISIMPSTDVKTSEVATGQLPV